MTCHRNKYKYCISNSAVDFLFMDWRSLIVYLCWRTLARWPCYKNVIVYITLNITLSQCILCFNKLFISYFLPCLTWQILDDTLGLNPYSVSLHLTAIMVAISKVSMMTVLVLFIHLFYFNTLEQHESRTRCCQIHLWTRTSGPYLTCDARTSLASNLARHWLQTRSDDACGGRLW